MPFHATARALALACRTRLLTARAYRLPHARAVLLVLLEQLELEARIVPEQSSWSSNAVGRLTLTLSKEEATAWPRLAKAAAEGARRNPYITTWYEMQEMLGGALGAADEPDADATPAAAKPKAGKADGAPSAAGVPAGKPKRKASGGAGGAQSGGGRGTGAAAVLRRLWRRARKLWRTLLARLRSWLFGTSAT